ncbi:chemotaxis protein CheW [uncultured Enterovirga sp.]|uniref:chemotaxis protein CheW n=1 Tax=uncultured Enterovirga sp. TaxID=2026352 RepID=UPI0035CC3FE9
MSSSAAEPLHDASPLSTYVTLAVSEQLFALPIEHVRDVFVVSGLTRVPLAAPEIAGLVNLRGRVLTVIDLRRRLGLSQGGDPERRMAVGIEFAGECFGLLVDSVGEVIQLASSDLDDNPVHLPARWASLSRGIHPLPDRLLVVMDVEAVLDPGRAAIAA